jgi:imidazolonepropionase-like amidohydrolase
MKRNKFIKLLSLSTCIILFFAFIISAQESKKNTTSVYLVGGNLFDGATGKIIPDSLVIIQGDAITYAGPKKPFTESPDEAVVNCTGKTLLPGLFDAHIHLGGASILGYIPIDDQRKLSAFLYSGVTSVFDLGDVQDWIFSLRDAERQNKVLFPRIFAVGPLFTSPKGHGTEYGVPMALTPTTEQEARESVRKLIKAKPDQVKIIYEKGSKQFTSLSYELMEAIIDEAHKHKFTVITHATTLEQAKDAVKAGTDGLAHVMVDQELNDELLQDMKQHSVFCTPTLAVFEVFFGGLLSNQKYLEWPLVKSSVCQEIITDLKKQKEIPWLERDSEDRMKKFAFAKKNVKKMYDYGIKLALGTDAGNPAVFFGPSVHREMELLVEAGIFPADVIKAATINVAEILGQGDRLGTISEGKLADILVVDGDPLKDIRNTQDIFMVIKNGQILNREELARSINPPTKSVLRTEKKAKGPTRHASSPENDPAVVQQIVKAKELMKKGVDTWNSELMKKARSQFLGMLAKDKQESLYLLYYIALCDYRLANFYIASGEMDKAESYTKESQKYLEKAMERDPEFGELDALYASMLGFEIALHQEKAMSLGFQIFQYFGKAFQKSPDNPRIHFLKGVSDLFTPEQFGGGADAAIKSLNNCVELFEKEEITDPLKPSWGEEEAYTFLGMAYNKKGEKGIAEEFYRKALQINPNYGLAKEELRKMKK